MATCTAIEFNDELTCPFCLDAWSDPIELMPCGHIFCKACSVQGGSLFTECPVCRAPVQSSQAPHRTLINMALKVPVKCSGCGWTGTREGSLSHTCAANATAVTAATGTETQTNSSDSLTGTPSTCDGISSSVSGGRLTTLASLGRHSHLPPIHPTSAPATTSSSSAGGSYRPPQNSGSSGLDAFAPIEDGALLPVSSAWVRPLGGAPSSPRSCFSGNGHYGWYGRAQRSHGGGRSSGGSSGSRPSYDASAAAQGYCHTLTTTNGNSGASLSCLPPPLPMYRSRHRSNTDSNAVAFPSMQNRPCSTVATLPSPTMPGRVLYGDASSSPPARMDVPPSFVNGPLQDHPVSQKLAPQCKIPAAAYPPSSNVTQRPTPQEGKTASIAARGPTPWSLYDMTKEEFDQVTHIFNYVDSDKDGVLTMPEAARLMRWLNMAQTIGQVTRLIEEMDLDRDGMLSRDELLTWMKYNLPNPERLYGLTRSEYSSVMLQFHFADNDQDGWVREHEFAELCRLLGETSNPTEASRIFRTMDTLGRGKIDLHTYLMYRVKNKRRGLHISCFSAVLGGSQHSQSTLEVNGTLSNNSSRRPSPLPLSSTENGRKSGAPLSRVGAAKGAAKGTVRGLRSVTKIAQQRLEVASAFTLKKAQDLGSLINNRAHGPSSGGCAGAVMGPDTSIYSFGDLLSSESDTGFTTSLSDIINSNYEASPHLQTTHPMDSFNSLDALDYQY